MCVWVGLCVCVCEASEKFIHLRAYKQHSYNLKKNNKKKYEENNFDLTVYSRLPR